MKSETDETLGRIDALRAEYRDEKKGYRLMQYVVLAQTMNAVLELRENPDTLKMFLKRANARAPKSGADGQSWITTAVVKYVTGTTKGLAWKRARVLEYLYDQGLSTFEIPFKLKELGGIERVLRARKEVSQPENSTTRGNNEDGRVPEARERDS